MVENNKLDVFLNPDSVAVIGATERPGSWGSFIMGSLVGGKYPGKLYPVNKKADKVNGIPAYKDIRDIDGPVELAVLTIPSDSVEEAVTSCGEKGVKGITIITAGYGESIEGGSEREKAIAEIARSYGMRLIGPNVSGTFNLHTKFSAAATTGGDLQATPLAGISQGGFAFYDLISSGAIKGMGVGRFIHTGNECDLTVTDFLEEFGNDPDVQGIVMYLETIRDGRRFLDVAREVVKNKPVVVHKAGRTKSGARAANSHTGALAGRSEIFEGFLNQSGIIISPTMEFLFPITYALLERPPMRGKKVCIMTVGGSWGVTLSDALEEKGLEVTTLSKKLQEKLGTLGMPPRASTKNPVDLGAAGIIGAESDTVIQIGRAILDSGEVDALILHGFGKAGMIDENTPKEMSIMVKIDKDIMQGFNDLEKETGLPVLIASHHNLWQSQVVWDLNKQGIRVYNQLDEIAQILYSMHDHWKKNQS